MPPRTQEPAEQQRTPGAATVATAAAPTAAASITPAVAAALAGPLTAAAVAKATSQIVSTFVSWAKVRGGDGIVFLGAALARQYPDRPQREIRFAVSREEEFEREFRRKMRLRLQRDIPKALSITDPDQRRAALEAIFARERRYTQMREEAMLARAIS